MKTEKKSYARRIKKCVKNTCSTKLLKKRLPIIGWLPKYKTEYIIQDIIAGITVGLTAIPQGIAYAVIAGLPPEHGLYASLTSGIIYVVFGSCYNVTVGPTAILASMTAKYVTYYSADFAMFAAFLSGVFILLLGVLNLGFLVEFISMPVLSGFLNAAALQIAATQLKLFFGLDGSPGGYFAESIYNFFDNIKTTKVWDPILGSSTIIMLILLKKMGEGCKRTDGFVKQTKWFISMSRNAVVVIIGMIIAYGLKHKFDAEPLIIIGDIGKGLPEFGWPPVSTTVGNQTFNFIDMVQILGMQSVVIPFVAILETVAIAKAFAEGGRIDATQEMIAIGLCNVVGSCGQSMPITGSFARTALNHISGVKTQAGGITKVILLAVSLIYLTSTFYYIPKSSLAGVIITALFSMMDYEIVISLWRSSIKELMLLVVTMVMSLFFGLEYGIMTGILSQALMLLYNAARPPVDVEYLKCEKGDQLVVVNFSENMSYCATEFIRQKVMRATCNAAPNMPIVLNGTYLKRLDYTAAFNLMSLIKDLDKTYHIIMLNFNIDLRKLCLSLDSQFETKFVNASSPLELFLRDNFSKDVS